MKLRMPAMEDVGFQMAPMIDCVFQLMIFFMCASHLHITMDRTPVAIPVAENANMPKEMNDRRTISIDAKGLIVLSGQPASLEEVKKTIAKTLKQVPNLKVILRADKELQHKVVREVMQACAEAGAAEIIFAAYQSDKAF